jgi:hypothetical protein
MAGLPGESLATLRETKEFAMGLDIPWGFHLLAPFPGTTVREEIERYDLEILTSDWSLYDANRAVTRTSHISPEEVERFVADLDEESRLIWEEMIEAYKNGTATPDEALRVSGHYRMNLTYRLLAEDLLEDHCTFPVKELNNGARSAEALLFEKVTRVTDLDSDLVTHTMKDFIDKGYIKARQTDGTINWYWTHNRKEDYGPFSRIAAG